MNPAVWLAFCTIGVAFACGGDDKPAPLTETVPPGAGPAVAPPSSGGVSGRGNQGNEGGDPGSDPGGPVVTIVSPAAASDPNEDEVIVARELDVVCRVEQSPEVGAAKVDASSVTIDLLDAEGEQIDSLSAAPTDKANEYRAHFFLADIDENGPVSFRCNAIDLGLPPLRGVDTIQTFYDRGPIINVVAPVPDSAHALLGAVRFEFEVEESPLADGDTEARVDEVSLEVNGVEMRGVRGDRGTYETSVDFADRDVFPDVPNGAVPVIIRATNLRTPEAATREERYDFIIDGEGPIISISSPQNEDVVGGQVALRFSVSDELSGVNADTIVIELNGKEYHYGQGGSWAKEGDSYVFLFDSVQAEKDSKIQATITIRAVDEVGNESEGESLIVYLDNVPPVVDLDPPPLIEARVVEEQALNCSAPFDPVGDFAANDEEEVLDVTRIRAIAADRTNTAPGQKILYYAAVNPDSVYVYMQPDPNEPLLIDTNDDGYCDDIVANRNDLPFQHLNGVRPVGSAWFWGEGAADPADPSGVCVSYTSSAKPEPLCHKFNDLSRVAGWDVDDKIPLIYAVGALDQGPACTGTDWEIAQFLDEGWFCLAARAVDNVGNVGISPPLRLCYNDGISGGEPDCSDPPSCTDGCTPPDGYPELIHLLGR